MQYMNTNMKKMTHIIGLAVLLVVAELALAATSFAQSDEERRAPDLSAPFCDTIQVPAGHKVSFHVYALGVQTYRWNGARWDFVAPTAVLFADAGFHGKVGTHYAGPTWESNSGSKVAARRVPGTGCTPDASAIPWLLLESVSTEGPGIFRNVTHIQRVNTVGGLPPTTPGSHAGAEARVPYTAEYYFYRAEN